MALATTILTRNNVHYEQNNADSLAQANAEPEQTMSEEKQFSVKELSERVGGRVFGDDSVTLFRVAALENAGANEIAYVEDSKHFAAAQDSRAGGSGRRQ